jgi:dual specificity tyrosine-phosphorylation-regulated kinase 1
VPSRSPHSIQYCDANFDYIVRPGDMFHNRYMLEKVIGRGSFGQVVRAYDTRSKAHVAIKIIKNNALYVEQALSEVRMTAYLNRIDPDDAHAIMRIFDKFIYRGHQCLVLELLSFSLYDLLRSTEFYGVSLNLVRKFSRQILNCLSFLSREDVNIAHCDLKPENVLLRHPQRSAIKVVDFGASCRVSDSMFTYVQSRFYRAPEVILGLPYSTQVDVWSLGCMLVELHTGYPLFAGRDEADQMAVIVERLGVPPRHMLERGKKTHLFFDRVRVDSDVTGRLPGNFGGEVLLQDEQSGGTAGAVPYEWVLKPTLGKKPGEIIPGSKPIRSFVDDLTSGISGKRKRVSGGHSEIDYLVFLDMASEMLRYDPEERITAREAVSNPFVEGMSAGGRLSNSTTSGRDSPPPIPVSAAVSTMQQVEPGRAAPVHPRTGNALVSGGSSSRRLADVGGLLRLSKSESAIAPVTNSLFALHASEWAEEVGIEPPPWRAGGPVPFGGRGYSRREEDDEPFSRSCKPESLPGAGGGAPLRPPGLGLPPRPDTSTTTASAGPASRRSGCPGGLSRVVSRLPTRLRREEENLPQASFGHSSMLAKVPCI